MILPVYPFDPDRCIGTIIEVTGTLARVNLPQAAAPGSRWHHGFKLEAGRVGEFVVLEASETAVFGRITSVRLPERERLSVEEELGKRIEVHPVGMVHLMASVSLVTGKIEPGVPNHPRLAARCFSAHPTLVQYMAESSRGLVDSSDAKLVDIATLPFSPETHIRLSPESIFGRHCAIVGATGGGKSWTVARLIEQVCRFNSKVVLIDATGEYSGWNDSHVTKVHINKDTEAASNGSTQVGLPHKLLTDEDFFALFLPSPLTQQPRLRGALRSLKLVRCFEAQQDLNLDLEQKSALNAIGGYIESGRLAKAGRKRSTIEKAMRLLSPVMDRSRIDFDVHALVEQINLECVFPTGKDSSNYGDLDTRDQGYCTTLLLRISQQLVSADHEFMFGNTSKDNVMDKFREFFHDESKRLFIISLKELSFSHHLREILVNAMGRLWLRTARTGGFSSKPLVVVLDEAHQFIGKTVGDEFARFPLDAFEIIAKEGRKYGLTLGLATQRPRDIGHGILSQMGTFLVHRLTNPDDRDIIERAAGDLDKSAAAFIPTLAAGQAILIGIDYPIPVTIEISKPSVPPQSRGPQYQQLW